MFESRVRLFLLLLVAGCAFACAGKVSEQLQATPPLARLNKIAVVVVPGQELPGHEAGTAPSTEEISVGIAALDEILQEHFANQPRITMLTNVQTEAMLMETQADPARTARKIGENTGSDGVLIVHVFRFRQRLAAKSQPASVAFDFRLTTSSTGRNLCSGRFDETQQTLTDNLLHIGAWFKRGNKWLTAEQLAREGVVKMLDDCPALTP